MNANLLNVDARRAYWKSELSKCEFAATFAVNPRMAAYPKAKAAQLRFKLEQFYAVHPDAEA